LKVSDIKRIKGDMVLEIQRKGRAYKEQVLLHPEVFEPIENYLLARTGYQESDPLFANHSQHPKKDISEGMFSRIIKNYLKQISNSKKLTCHSLRHSTAINLLKSGKSIYDVQQLLSHRQVTTTELYLNAIKAEKRFNNPLTYDVIDIYKNGQKTVKNT